MLALARLGKRLERAQGAPQDVEFAVEGGGDAAPGLLQCRPETVGSTRPRPPRFTGGDAAAWLGEAVGLLAGGPRHEQAGGRADLAGLGQPQP